MDSTTKTAKNAAITWYVEYLHNAYHYLDVVREELTSHDVNGDKIIAKLNEQEKLVAQLKIVVDAEITNHKEPETH